MWPWSKNRLTLGQRGEKFAQAEYQRQEYTILAQNVFNRKGKQLGEIDFIAKRGNILCFVEVKTRAISQTAFGNGLDAVNSYKQAKILKAVKLFLQRNPHLQSCQPRIDVCSIEWTDLDKTPQSVIIISNAVEDLY